MGSQAGLAGSEGAAFETSSIDGKADQVKPVILPGLGTRNNQVQHSPGIRPLKDSNMCNVDVAIVLLGTGLGHSAGTNINKCRRGLGLMFSSALQTGHRLRGPSRNIQTWAQLGRVYQAHATSLLSTPAYKGRAEAAANSLPWGLWAGCRVSAS